MVHMMVHMRRLIGGAIAAVLIVVLTPAAAHADGEWVEEETSQINSVDLKAVTARCPQGTVVVGVGGRTRQAGGKAVLVGVVPNADLTEVTALARALPGHVLPWGVTATAMCAEPEGYAPVWQSAAGTSVATVLCPRGKVLYSTGFLVSGGQGIEYVSSIVPALDGKSATVKGVSTRLNAFAVCGDLVTPYGRTEHTVPIGPGPTTAGQAPPLIWSSWVFGAGVHTDRAGMFIDGFSPSVFDDGSGLNAKGRVARLSPTLPRLSRSAAINDDGNVTFYGQSIGSWY